MADESIGEAEANEFRMLGSFQLARMTFTVLEDDAPCQYGYLLFAKNGAMKLRAGGNARAEYAAKRKRIGPRVVNIGPGIRG